MLESGLPDANQMQTSFPFLEITTRGKTFEPSKGADVDDFTLNTEWIRKFAIAFRSRTKAPKKANEIRYRTKGHEMAAFLNSHDGFRHLLVFKIDQVNPDT